MIVISNKKGNVSIATNSTINKFPNNSLSGSVNNKITKTA
jgi:hypothetical protein